MQHVGVAVSGGGHRASLFGLGALLYLVDAGKGPEISCVSSVSGGSITNGYVGLTTDLTTITGEEFRRQVKPLARAVSTGGGIGHFWLTYAYLGTAALILALGAALTALAIAELTHPFVAVPAAVVLVAITLYADGWFLLRRGWVARQMFDHNLYKGAPLSAVRIRVDHVICACELQSGLNVYFSGGFVSTYHLGRGAPGGLRLSQAVQASAALPVAFAPSVLPLAPHSFPRTNPEIPRLLLADGGVYDNMATEWPLGDRAKPIAGTGQASTPHPIDELVAVNASAPGDPKKQNSIRVPLLGEATALLADKGVLYVQTTAVRRRLIYARVRATQLGVTDKEIRLTGGMAQINQSPYKLPGDFVSGADAMAVRAKAALNKLPPPDTNEAQEWAADVRANALVKTTLSRIPADRAARLMRHAYVLTMVNLHVLSDYPLLDIPAVDSFLALVT